MRYAIAAADRGQDRPVAGGDAQAGDRPSEGPPGARRLWQVAGGSRTVRSRRWTLCAARKRPNIPTGSSFRPKRAILDQIGQTAERARLYRKALDLKPNEPSILSNLGMSYVLRAICKTAETYLRHGHRPARRRQPRAAEPGAGRRPARPLRRSRADRQRMNFRPSRRRPISPICAACWPSRTPGANSRKKKKRKKKAEPTN